MRSWLPSRCGTFGRPCADTLGLRQLVRLNFVDRDHKRSNSKLTHCWAFLRDPIQRGQRYIRCAAAAANGFSLRICLARKLPEKSASPIVTEDGQCPHRLSPHDEINVYESAEARFEVAAKASGFEEGVYRFMRYPNKEITVYIPVTLDNGQLEVFIGYRVQHSLVRGPCKGGIRFAPDVTLDEVRALGQLDDLEMRGRQHTLRRRQGRCNLRSGEAFPRRTRAHHPPLHRRTERVVRARTRRSRARPRHQRADHGLDHGHLLHARPPHHHCRRHREACGDGRLARAPPKPPVAAC